MKKTLISLALISMLATACVPAVLVGASTATGAAIGRDSRTLQTMSDDIDIEFQASRKLHTDRFTDTNITVTSFNHIVLLVGQVPSEAIRAKAEADVQSIPKVQRVYNLIKVAPLEGIIQSTDDARIAANIKTRMTFTSNLNSNNFKVIVVNRVVYLMGYTTNEQAEVALNVIRNSSDVERVINLVEYKTDNGPEKISESSQPTKNTQTPEAITGTVAEPLTITPTSSS